MVKDINIHIKTSGSEKAERNLKDVGKQAKGVGTSAEKGARKTSGAGKKIMGALKNLAGPLGFAAFATAAVTAIKKVIDIINEMKRAVNEAVKALAAAQQASADFFEAMDAYTPKKRKEALGQAQGLQAKTGLPVASSKRLMEIYKRTYGELPSESLEQAAGYWQLHGGEATEDLIRWMGASGVKDTKRQGQILRMISTTATETGMRDPEIIRGITQYSTEFRQFGWSPEKTILNVGKVVAGLGRREARRAIGGLVEGLKTLTEEKALKEGASPEIAESQQKRIEWAGAELKKLSPEKRSKRAQELFGKTYGAYVTKYMTGQLTPKTEEALRHALSAEGERAEREKVLSQRETAESITQQVEGVGGQFGLDITKKEKNEAALREIGQKYLKYLKRKDPAKYHLIKLTHFGDEAEKEAAAYEMWWSQLSAEEKLTMPGGPSKRWESFSAAEKLKISRQNVPVTIGRYAPATEESEELQAAQPSEIHYHKDMNFFPTVGNKHERGIGERIEPGVQP